MENIIELKEILTRLEGIVRYTTALEKDNNKMRQEASYSQLQAFRLEENELTVKQLDELYKLEEKIGEMLVELSNKEEIQNKSLNAGGNHNEY